MESTETPPDDHGVLPWEHGEKTWERRGKTVTFHALGSEAKRRKAEGEPPPPGDIVIQGTYEAS